MNQVYEELKTLIGTQKFKEKAIEKTAKTTNLINKLPDNLKIKVEAISSILEGERIYLENINKCINLNVKGFMVLMYLCDTYYGLQTFSLLCLLCNNLQLLALIT